MDNTTSGTRLTVATGLRGNDNAFGVIRLVLASAVIFSHAFYLGPWISDPTHELTRGQESIGGFAVVGFFIVSGYLITKSGMRTDIVQFLWHRALRIFPAFWVVLGFSAAYVGPLVWMDMGRPLTEYVNLAPGGPAYYMASNAMLDIRQWGILDIFAATTPYGSTTGGSVLNGSLWTLAYEWRAYLIVAAFLLIGALKRSPKVVSLAGLLALVAATLETIGPNWLREVVPGIGDHQTVILTYAFLIGGTIAVWGARIVLDFRLAIAAGIVAGVTLFSWGWVPLGYPALAYVIMFAAAKLPAWWRKIGSVNDYSYGMYVYGFLVQQVTAYLGWHTWGYVPWVAATLAITAVLAYLSWHGVEKRALAWKKRGPGRGIRYWADRLRPGRSQSQPSL